MYFIIKGEVAVTFPTRVGGATGTDNIVDVVTNATNLKREMTLIGGSSRGNPLSKRNTLISGALSGRHSA